MRAIWSAPQAVPTYMLRLNFRLAYAVHIGLLRFDDFYAARVAVALVAVVE